MYICGKAGCLKSLFFNDMTLCRRLLNARRGLRITSAGRTAEAALTELRQVLDFVLLEPSWSPVVTATTDIAGTC